MTNLEHKKGGKACALYLPLGRLWQEGADEQVVGGKGNGEELGGEEGVHHVHHVHHVHQVHQVHFSYHESL